ncbi:MAG: hypothetical protein ACR2GQ_01595 [Gemmatimonadota bacterium]
MKIRESLLVGMLGTLGLVLASCSGNRAPEPSGETPAREPDAAAERARTTVQAVYDFGMSFGTTRAELREGLGRPEDIEVELAENRHDASSTDSLFVVRYPGLRFSLNRPGPVGHDLLTEVVLTDRGQEVPGGIRPGSTTRADVEDALGPADSTLPLADTLVLVHATPNPGAEEYVQFYVVAGVVERIRWIPYVD